MKMIISILFLSFSLTLYGQSTSVDYYHVIDCDTTITHLLDSVFTSCTCFQLSKDYLLRKDGRIDFLKLKRSFGIELPERTGTHQQWYDFNKNEFSVMFISKENNGITTRTITWKYDCSDNKLKLLSLKERKYLH